jgi:excisionase family DNA binding protein
MSPTRPPEAYVHGLDGPCVLVPGRVAALLLARTDLRSYHAKHRGEDPEVDAVLVGLKVAAAAWGATVADRGNGQAERCPWQPGSAPWLSTRDAARRLCCSPRTVRWAIAQGRLPAVWFRGGWVLDPVEVEHYRARRAG